MDEVLMTLTPARSTVAYFSMEICLEQEIPTYSGGLGVLSGDTLRSAADLGAPVVGVTLLHRQAYFSMEICLEQEIPTYSGGLGVLSGDTLRSAADLGAPVVGVTLLHRQGY